MHGHISNGLPNLVHRHKNIIWKGLSDDRLSIMIITDGNHLLPNMIAPCFALKLCNPLLLLATWPRLQDGWMDQQLLWDNGDGRRK